MDFKNENTDCVIFHYFTMPKFSASDDIFSNRSLFPNSTDAELMEIGALLDTKANNVKLLDIQDIGKYKGVEFWTERIYGERERIHVLVPGYRKNKFEQCELFEDTEDRFDLKGKSYPSGPLTPPNHIRYDPEPYSLPYDPTSPSYTPTSPSLSDDDGNDFWAHM
jgi:hypothetical protein